MTSSVRHSKKQGRQLDAIHDCDSFAQLQKQLIQESHERSRQYGVDPYLDKCPKESSLTASQLKKRISESQPFFDLAMSQLSTLYNITEGSGFAMALTDSEGYILHTIGEGQMMAQYESRNCLPGFRWTERDVGTCAIGVCLHNLAPVQLPGSEMFSVNAQHVTNSAAPVFDDDHRLLGIIVLSGPAEQVHIHTLAMVIQAAETIRSQVSELKKTEELALKNRYMTALLESDNRGVIALDRRGQIVQLNQKAKRMLGFKKGASNKRINNLIRSEMNFDTYLRQGIGFAERELTYNTGRTGRTLFIALDPITMPDGDTAGGLLMLMEKQRVMKLVNEMVGSQARFTFDSIIGKSDLIIKAKKLARIAARGNTSVLLQGETGTGKELFAQAIHNAGPQRDRPFVVINCGAVPRELLESELFGYTEGAFTGAKKGGRPGKFELADGGTIFLDEIGDMPLDMQVKILRTLQSGEVQRIGGRHPVIVDLRVIAATNVDLGETIDQGRFRQDLFYRISTLQIDIPPLRYRRSDVILLADFFLERMRSNLARPDLTFSSSALDLMKEFSWPGNIRQLENSVERAINVAEGDSILSKDLGLYMTHEDCTISPSDKDVLLEEMERKLISKQMKIYKGNISQVARIIGVSRPTLYRKLRKYSLK